MAFRNGTIRFALVLLAALTVLPAQAQLFRAYLSSAGNDANACTLAAPCRLLPAAMNAVANGGEVWILDSANYNTTEVTLAKSVSLRAVPGVIGSFVTANGTAALRMNAAVTVSLTGITVGPIAGQPAGTSAIIASGGATLTLEACTVAGATNSGVSVGGSGTVARIVDTTLRGNAIGISVSNGAKVVVAKSRLLGNTTGMSIVSTQASIVTTATVGDTVVSGGTTGISTQSVFFSGAEVRVVANGVTIENVNGPAVQVFADGAGAIGTVVLGRSTITANATVLALNANNGATATAVSLGDNAIELNGGPGTGAFTPGALK